MRILYGIFFVTACWLTAVPAARAQQQKPLVIEAIQVGFQRQPASSQPRLSEPIFKSGSWTPVYIYLTGGPQGSGKPADIVVETDDSDDIKTRYTMSVPPLGPNEPFLLMTYSKFGSAINEVTVEAVIDGRTVATAQQQPSSTDLGNQIVLSVGAALPQLRHSFARLRRQMRGGGQAPAEDDSLLDDQGALRRLAVLDDVRLLPRRWFGYEAVDVVVLSTGDRNFTKALLEEKEGRKEALVEWVRRGGRLIISVGRNRDMVVDAGMEQIQAALPVTLTGLTQLPQLQGLSRFCNESRPFNQKPVPIEVLTIEPRAGKEIETMLPADSRTPPPLIVRGAYGLGSVTLVAFDVDVPPFTSLLPDLQQKFWTELVNRTAGTVQIEPDRGVGQSGPGNQGRDLSTQLQDYLEQFQDIPVISFGWVALFILVYILIVGPLDYLFLKKVVKRLELTWITFPTIVITISVIAYFTAYWLKGNDQRVNKVDVVDIDLEGSQQRVYGNTWFTIFSPRIQQYTLCVEPLGGPGARGQNASVNVSWLGQPEETFRGVARPRSQGLFRRAYDYVPDAGGLVGVPIQVWATKSFESRWEVAPTQPLISADLRRPKGKREGLSGEITSHLPVALDNVALLFRKGTTVKWYDLDRLLPGIPKRLDNLPREGKEMNQWAGEYYGDEARPRTGRPNELTVSPLLIKKVLFQRSADLNVRNNALRYLDQSWRLSRKDEVIIFGRVKREEGPAEAIAHGSGSLSQLWIGALPAPGQVRPPLLGSLAQEGFVRIIIPIKDADAP